MPKVISCKGCTDRTIEPNCHMTCERYLNDVEENRKMKQKIHEAQNFDVYHRNLVVSVKTKRWKRDKK